MPIIIVINDFLPLNNNAENEQLQASIICGIEQLIEHSSKKYNKLEYIAVIDSDIEPNVLVHFTRDYNSIRKALDDFQIGLPVDWNLMIGCINDLVFEEWMMEGKLLVYCICGTYSLKGTSKTSEKKPIKKRPISPKDLWYFNFDFEAFVTIMVMTTDKKKVLAKEHFQKILSSNSQNGSVECLEWKNLDLVSKSFLNSINNLSVPHIALFFCGKMSSYIQLFPPVKVFSRIINHEQVNKRIGSKLKLCGFISLSDLGSPPFVSKHFVIAIPQGKPDDSQKGDTGNFSNITVLLHGSLKVRQMAALVFLSPSWYGLICPCSDSKKKSNLILYVLEPGNYPVTWLGNISEMVSLVESPDNPFLADKNPFPVKTDEKPSYNQPTISWVKSTGVQADIQKIVRLAKKLPEKESLFYKEINRVRKAALSFGFIKLIQGLSNILEREISANENLTPLAKEHLSRTVLALRSPSVLQVYNQIKFQ